IQHTRVIRPARHPPTRSRLVGLGRSPLAAQAGSSVAPRVRLRPPRKARAALRTGCPRAIRNAARWETGAAECPGLFRAGR
ncbi:MAG: hypothetical protein ACRDYA_13840, partial [Egibacteraceae bacterium]